MSLSPFYAKLAFYFLLLYYKSEMAKYGRKGLKAKSRGRKSAKKTLGKSTATAVKAIVQSQLSKVVETKIADYAFEPTSLAAFYHNTWYQFESDPYTMFQGTSDSETLNPINRIGDSIYVKGIHFKLYLTTDSVRPSVAYRIVILKCKASVSSPVDITSHPQSTNKLIMPVDRENVNCRSVVYDRVIRPCNTPMSIPFGSAVADVHHLWSHFVPVNKKIFYDDGAAQSKGDTYRIFCLAYDTQANNPTSNVGRFSYFRRTYFQDS